MDRPVLSKYEGHLLSRPGCSKFAMVPNPPGQQPDETRELVQRETSRRSHPVQARSGQYNTSLQISEMVVISDSAAAPVPK
jgi:hypothetical protein